MSVLTPMGEIYLRAGEFLPAGTAFALNLGIMRPVEMITPGKGNFYREQRPERAKSIRSSVSGGLDYGVEFYHGKFTNLSTDFKAPTSGRPVYLVNPAGTIATTASVQSAVLNKTTVEASNTAKVAVASVGYDVNPATAATLAYLWQIRAKERH